MQRALAVDMRRTLAIGFASLATAAAVACSSHHNSADQNAPDAPVHIGGSPDATCGGSAYNLTYVAPNLLFVIDRSCSMTQELEGSNETKWEAAVAAITNVLSTYNTQINWGMTLFPDTVGSACTQGAIPVPLGSDNAATISSMLTAALGSNDPLYPDNPCVTPIDTGLEQAATDPGLADPTRKSYLMLVTDGAQASCSAGGSDTGSENAVSTLESMGVNTFVVGFGSKVDTTFLNALAALGGEALSGSNKFYQADTAADLEQAFTTIGQSVVSCDYAVDPAPPDPSQLYVWFDDVTMVPHDPTHMDGWDYSTTTQLLTLYGAACTSLQNHTVTSLEVMYGCPSPPIQ
jgi:hypothetical protein